MIIDLKRNFISTSDSRSPASEPIKVSFILEMANLGYIVPVQAVEKASQTELKKLLSAAKNFRGANHAWVPMYPNFPQQVIDAPAAELYWNALIHYAGVVFDLNIRPEYPVQLRETLKVLPENLQVLEIKTEREILESKIGFLQNKVSLSQADFSEIEEYLKQYGAHDSVTLLSTFNFPNKENWISAIKLARSIGVTDENAMHIALETAKTPTDLLRAIFMLFSATENTVYIDLTPRKQDARLGKIPRPVRKQILAAIDSKFTRDLDDYYLNSKLWKIVGRGIHPGDFPEFPKAIHAFDIARGNVEYKTFEARWKEAVESGTAEDVVTVLSERPGVFARNLDFALRSFPTKEQVKIVRGFEKVAGRVSTTVLVSSYNGLSNRNNEASVIRTKTGATANVTNVKAHIPEVTISAVQRAILKGLRSQFQSKESMGKVYVDPELQNYFAPLQQRTVSDGRLLPRGSRMPLPDTNLRFFVQWYNVDEHYGRVDIDMDAIFLDNNLTHIDNVSYTRLKNAYATHSGDLTDAPRPQGAAEFVDVDTAKARRLGVRYVVMSFNVYSGPALKEIENYTGFMTRDGDAQRGEIFDPKTIHTSFTSTASGKNAIPAVFDLETNQMIWLDSSFGQAQSGFSAYSGAGSIAETVRLELDKKQLTMYDVIVANVEARGTLVNKEAADKVYSADNVDPFDANGFIAEFL